MSLGSLLFFSNCNVIWHLVFQELLPVKKHLLILISSCSWWVTMLWIGLCYTLVHFEFSPYKKLNVLSNPNNLCWKIQVGFLLGNVFLELLKNPRQLHLRFCPIRDPREIIQVGWLWLELQNDMFFADLVTCESCTFETGAPWFRPSTWVNEKHSFFLAKCAWLLNLRHGKPHGVIQTNWATGSSSHEARKG